jgi:hypothetical protein
MPRLGGPSPGGEEFVETWWSKVVPMVAFDIAESLTRERDVVCGDAVSLQ